jgi:poly-gamma-glutamate capsule biosynthesis protein CapA/YwtB (metallophosphatase superfamily)
MPKFKHYCFLLFLILPTLFVPYSTFAFSEEELIISAVGDIMLGSTYPELMFPKEDEKVSNLNFLNVFEGSHIVFGNLEGPICSKGKTNKCPNWGQKCFAFKMPISSAEELRKAGFNVLSIANNHIFDFGKSCAEETISFLQAQNIKPVGGKYVAEFEVGKKKNCNSWFFLPTFRFILFHS